LGSAIGCNDLAILWGTDFAHAIPLLERACELGLARGCANLGSELLQSTPGEAERRRAVGLLSGACDQADGFACAELGDALYAVGEQGDKASYGGAHVAYEKGCKLGRVTACCAEGWMLRRGEGTAKDARRSRELFRFSCDQQFYAGCAALGYDLLNDAQNPTEYEEGARWAQMACEHDDGFGCFSLGAAAVASAAGDAQKVRLGVNFLKRSCQLGFANGCSYAATLEQRSAAPPSPTSNDTEADEEEAPEED
jgi:uncharacterized protein